MVDLNKVKTYSIKFFLVIALLTFPTLHFDDIIRIPILNANNISNRKENILLKLGCLEFDVTLRVDEPPALTKSTTLVQISKNERCERSNRLCLLFMKSHINKSIQSYIPEIDKTKAFLNAVEE